MAVRGLFAGLSVPILSGPLKGARWSPASGGKLFRVYGGSYEREQTAAFVEQLGPGDVFFDVGAHVGYYTVLASRLVGPEGKVVAFEPSRRNLPFLERHVRINRLENVLVVDEGVGASAGTLAFAAGTGSGTGRLAEEGDYEVPVTTLDGWCTEADVWPTHLKVDTEGGEVAVLEGGAKLFSERRPVMFLSTHGEGLHRECVAKLREWGYALESLIGEDVERTSELLCVPAESGTPA